VLLTAEFSAADALGPLIERAWNEWQGLDLLVNNAGADLLTGPAARLDYARKLDQLLDIDVRGTLLLSREIGHRMRDAGEGVILNIGWDQADRGMEGDSGELFAAAKNAIMGFTRSLALSLAPAGAGQLHCPPAGFAPPGANRPRSPGRSASSARPPLARWGQPEDIAKLARFLLSRDASYLTGQVINANGGRGAPSQQLFTTRGLAQFSRVSSSDVRCGQTARPNSCREICACPPAWAVNGGPRAIRRAPASLDRISRPLDDRGGYT
jgi:3-oxoacyl-[acyl-carrier protein] reductase